MGNSLYSCERSKYFLYFCVFTCFTGDLLRVVPVAAYASVVCRGSNISVNNRNCLPRILSCVRSNVDLRKYSNYEPIVSNSLDWSRFRTAGVGRVFCGVCNSKSFFCFTLFITFCLVRAGFGAPLNTARVRIVKPTGRKRQRRPASYSALLFI